MSTSPVSCAFGSPIAATLTRDRSAGRGGQRQRAADAQAVIVGERLRDDRAGGAQARDDRVRALLEAQVDRVVRTPGARPLTTTCLPNAFAWSWRTRGDALDAGSARDGGPDRGRDGVEAALGGHDVVGADRLLVGAARGGAEAAEERGAQRDERQPDHQRGGGGGRARRVARGVAAGQPAGGTAEAPRGRADDRWRAGRTRRPAIMITPRKSARAPTPTRIIDMPRDPPPSAPARHSSEPRRRGSSSGSAGLRAPSRGGRVAPSRRAAIGAIRVARRAGEMLAIRVTTMPSASATMIVRGSTTVEAVRQVDAERLEERVQALREREAEHEADDRGEHAHRRGPRSAPSA